MPIRLTGMTYGGKLSLWYLCFATLVACMSRGSVIFVLGFPLLHIPLVCQYVFGDFGWMPREWQVLIVVLLWVANAYLVGHTAAYVFTWWDRQNAPTSEDEEEESQPEEGSPDVQDKT